MDIQIGEEIPQWDMPSVSAARMRTMAAILRDPNPVHWDSRAVEERGYGKHTINQGPLGLSYMVNMLHAWTGPTSIRRVFMTFPMSVLDEDHIIAKGKVTAIREENGERLIDCDIWLHREGTNNPLEGHATVAVPA
ncbi:MAG: acyl dehydratase [Limisphaerales bacterium]|jgi:acyl dehydratase